ncbi:MULTISPECIES: hypothetical protein [unclassified Pseudofrankia]|uniref:hypothetical protein n=1 Tax=unclassified Pseudofrankia TaxID=2994372 RepID=UPI0012FF7619|nr:MULTISPECIES: hypothetical protein [unclassified Pseudofrankia]MDT3442682.1 hypothetical protein [Pseudofrankia sp. BMG5.37]
MTHRPAVTACGHIHTPDMTAVDEGHLLVATSDGIYESRDAGATFARILPLAEG